MNEDKKQTFITTYTGQIFYPFNPSHKSVDIIDIAHTLSQKVRWNGHTKIPYTVGAHSIQAARRVESHGGKRREILAALLHDASEAYFADVPTPIKIYMPDLMAMESEIQRSIERAFGLEKGLMDCPLVKKVDKECLKFEAMNLLNKTPDRLIDTNIVQISKTIDCPTLSQNVSSEQIFKMFLDMFYSLRD